MEIKPPLSNLMSDSPHPASSKKFPWVSVFLKLLSSLRYELVVGSLLLALGILPRLTFVFLFPARPSSDFANIMDLALSFEKDILGRGNIYWEYFSPGLPLILAFLFRQISFPPEEIGRWATALVSGLPAVVPFLLWKDIFSKRVRVLAGILLALWPGQIVFSSVLAQDNWILLPSVILAALAVRVLAGHKPGNPIWAGLFFALTVAIRQEMLLALLPVAILAILGFQKENWLRNALLGSIVIGLIFTGLVVQRGLATGRYTITTNHLGVSILGSYVPGAGLGWISPIPYLNSVHPGMVGDENFEEEALQLVREEFLRRPGFHSIRIVGSALYNLFRIEQGLVPWSLTGEGVLPHRYRKSGNAFAETILPLLAAFPIIIHGLFLATVSFIVSKHKPLLLWTAPLLVSIALKIGLHAVIVSQPRYFLVVEALEMLVIAIVLDAILQKEHWKISLRSAAFGAAITAILLGITAQAQQYIQTYDVVLQTTYEFSIYTGPVEAHCTMLEGRLIYTEGNKASIQLINPEPRAQESAIAVCEVRSAEPQALRLSVFDAYPEGNLPARLRLIVSVNETEVLHHDIAAEPWTGWIEIPIGPVTPGSPLSFTVEVRAIHPDQGWHWGEASLTQFRIEAGN